jgi:hypothetical protein
LKPDERIILLANMLLQEVDDAGVSPRSRTIPDDIMNVGISVFPKYGTMYVTAGRQALLNGFKGVCTAKIK